MPAENPELIVFKKGALVARWTLVDGEYRVGRSSRNEIDLDGEGVSRLHARITVEADVVFIEDLGSKFGTFAESGPLAGRHEMKPGAPIRLGKLTLAIRTPASPPPNLPAATLPTANQLAALAARAAKPRHRKAPNPAAAANKGAPSWLRRMTPFAVNLVLVAAIVAVVLHLRNERQAAARDRAVAEAERAQAESVWARQEKLLRKASPTHFTPQPGTTTKPAAPSSIPNDCAQLRAFASQPNWSADRVRRLEDGTLRINLSALQITELSALRGLPVTELDLSNCLLRTLPDVSFLTLRRLSIRDTAITDLTPLAGHPLKELHLEGTPATNLAPLAGMPLENLTLDERLADLSALRGLPLRELDLRNHTAIRDFRPLLECRRLDILYAPENADLDCLREHPSLKFIAIRHPQSPKPNAVDGPTAVHYFWQKYGPLMQQRAANSRAGEAPR